MNEHSNERAKSGQKHGRVEVHTFPKCFKLPAMYVCVFTKMVKAQVK